MLNRLICFLKKSSQSTSFGLVQVHDAHHPVPEVEVVGEHDQSVFVAPFPGDQKPADEVVANERVCPVPLAFYNFFHFFDLLQSFAIN